MTVAQVNEGSTSGNDGEIVEKVVLNGNWNDGGLMIGEVSDVYYFESYLLQI